MLKKSNKSVPDDSIGTELVGSATAGNSSTSYPAADEETTHHSGLVFGGYWKGAHKNVSGEDLLGNWKEVQATLGVVSALLLSIIYGQTGLDYAVHDDNLWGSWAGTLQSIGTFTNILNILICLYMTITSARAYILMCMYPSGEGKLCFHSLGPTFLLDIPYVLLPPLASLFVINAIIQATLALPVVVGYLALIASIIFISLAIYSWTILDKKGMTGLVQLGIVPPDLLNNSSKLVFFSRK
mmetsp:Transcript_30609/g.51233  ORF Transcript_30609/g.51233 Transcript_30609/m.51233 type:complete len:241 (+) Transcript_30609:50-772(+)